MFVQSGITSESLTQTKVRDTSPGRKATRRSFSLRIFRIWIDLTRQVEDNISPKVQLMPESTHDRTLTTWRTHLLCTLEIPLCQTNKDIESSKNKKFGNGFKALILKLSKMYDRTSQHRLVGLLKDMWIKSRSVSSTQQTACHLENNTGSQESISPPKLQSCPLVTYLNPHGVSAGTPASLITHRDLSPRISVWPQQASDPQSQFQMRFLNLAFSMLGLRGIGYESSNRFRKDLTDSTKERTQPPELMMSPRNVERSTSKLVKSLLDLQASWLETQFKPCMKQKEPTETRLKSKLWRLLLIKTFRWRWNDWKIRT